MLVFLENFAHVLNVWPPSVTIKSIDLESQTIVFCDLSYVNMNNLILCLYFWLHKSLKLRYGTGKWVRSEGQGDEIVFPTGELNYSK